MSDALDVAQLVLFERQCRDRGWWDRMRGCFHADSTVKLTWFQGSGADFVAGSEAGGAKCRHRLSPPVVHVDGDRAVVELPAAIEFQVQVDDVEADLISYARMLYRVERRVDEWKILKIDAIYERDTLTPAIPGVSLRVDSTRFAKFRPPTGCSPTISSPAATLCRTTSTVMIVQSLWPLSTTTHSRGCGAEIRAPSMRRPRSVPVPELRDSWAKSKSFTTGQCAVMNYNRQSMMAILHDKVHIARAVNAAKAIPLEDAPHGYAELDSGAATKYVLNPDGYVAA